eukprot:Tbor_TRINITY_DN1052_c0_g1::TRINITY_DN1052_c0_g1_i1::g.12370::m.12370
MSQYRTRILQGRKTMYERIFGYPEPQWFWDLALEVRIPGIICAYVVYVNTRLYYDSMTAYQIDSKWGMTRGKLLELRKKKSRYLAVPRYGVTYEFEVDGKKYTSTRATTGTPYRDWMKWMYEDTITESQYLQAMPVLRVGEKCTVFYNKSNPGGHSALAHDPNSWEISILCFCAAFPLLMGYLLKSHFLQFRTAYMPPSKMKVGFPSAVRPPPPPPPPRQPTQISPIPDN